MNTTQHPSPEVLADYASGALRLSHALCVATHIELCSSCKAEVQKLQSLGGQLLEEQFESSPQSQQASESLVDMKSSLLDSLDDYDNLDSAEEISPITAIAEPAEDSSGYRIPSTLRQFITENYDRLEWSVISTSIKIATLCKDKDGTQVALTRVKPGGKMPHHSHTGDEITVVLEGSFSDEDGLYKKGDIVFRKADEKHSPVVTNDGECICLAVMEGPIQFTGFFTRWLNPLMRWQYT
ncbi:MAG: ChrR family anti-sigma-E factor [Cellvibrionaceae bacterium]